MKRVAVVVVCSLLLARPAVAEEAPRALASIFSAKRQSELCVPRGDLGKVVDPLRLMQAIADDVPVPTSILDMANPAHERDGQVTPAEFRQTLLDPEPFGPAGGDPRIAAAAKGVRDRMGQLTMWLAGGGAPSQGYTVVQAGSDAPLASSLFEESATTRILCRAVSGPADSTVGPGAAPAGTTASALDRFLLRRKKEQLAKPRAELKTIDPAEISFRQDEKTNADTFQVNFVTGYVFGGEGSSADASWVKKWIPYLKYERTGNSDPKKQDVDALNPGLLFDTRYLSDNFATSLGLYPEAVLDFEQNSETLKLNAFAGPSLPIRLPSGTVTMFGGYLPLLGPFAFRPDLLLLAEYGHVLDAGKSADLHDDDSYGGLGTEVELKMAMPEVPLLRALVLNVRYRYVDLFSAARSRSKRLTTGLQYAIPGSDSLTLGLEYVDGLNQETLQDEEFWKLALGFRY